MAQQNEKSVTKNELCQRTMICPIADIATTNLSDLIPSLRDTHRDLKISNKTVNELTEAVNTNAKQEKPLEEKVMTSFERHDVNSSDSELRSLQDEVRTLRSMLVSKEIEISKEKAKTHNLKKDLDKVREEKSALTKTLAANKTKLKSRESNLVDAVVRNQRAQHKKVLENLKAKYNKLSTEYSCASSEMANLKEYKMLQVYEKVPALQKRAVQITEKLATRIKSNSRVEYENDFSKCKDFNESLKKNIRSLNLNFSLSKILENELLTVRKQNDNGFKEIQTQVDDILTACNNMFKQLSITYPDSCLKSIEKWSNELDSIDRKTFVECFNREANLQFDIIKKLGEERCLLESILEWEKINCPEATLSNIDHSNNLEKETPVENTKIIIFNLIESESDAQDVTVIERFFQSLTGQKIACKSAQRMGRPRDKPRPTIVTLINSEDVNTVFKMSKKPKLAPFEDVGIAKYDINHQT